MYSNESMETPWSDYLVAFDDAHSLVNDTDLSTLLAPEVFGSTASMPITIPSRKTNSDLDGWPSGPETLNQSLCAMGVSWDDPLISPSDTFSWPSTLQESELQLPTTSDNLSFPNQSFDVPFLSSSWVTDPSHDLAYDPSYDPQHKPESLFSIGSLDARLDSLDVETFGSLDNAYVVSAPKPVQPTSVEEALSNLEQPVTNSLSESLSTSPSKRAKGRKGPLAPRNREEASKMRGLGACPTCRRRKAKCDGGIYCKACINYWGTSLLAQPDVCRGRGLECLTDLLLGGQIFPRKRPPTQFLGQDYQVEPDAKSLGIILGFGSPLHVQVKLVHPADGRNLVHEHIEYPWQITNPNLSSVHQPKTVLNPVFPAVLADDASPQFRAVIDQHLGTLLDRKENFQCFPLYRSDLMILREVYVFYKALRTEESGLLREALKLLIAIHVGRDVSIDIDCMCNSRKLAQTYHLSSATGSPCYAPVPCLIRSQLAPVFQCLAKNYMRSVLQQVGAMLLSKEESNRAIATATYLVLLMIVESIQFHTSKQNYHAVHDKRATDCFQHPQIASSSSFDFLPGPSSEPRSDQYYHPHPPSLKPDSENVSAKRNFAVDKLLQMYQLCVGGWKASTRSGLSRSRSSSNAKSRRIANNDAGELFLTNVRSAVANAEPYLKMKRGVEAGVDRHADYAFDRLLARFFAL